MWLYKTFFFWLLREFWEVLKISEFINKKIKLKKKYYARNNFSNFFGGINLSTYFLYNLFSSINFI